MQVNQLSSQQLQAILSFAADNGRNWKSELRDSWMTCNYSGRTDGHLLQQIRNQFGPSWLVKFNLKAAQATIEPHKTAASLLMKRKPYRLIESSRHWAIFQHGNDFVSRCVFKDEIEHRRFHSLYDALGYCGVF